MGLIIRLHEVLNMIKGFTVGYSTSNPKQFILGYKGSTYKLTIENLEIEDTEENIQNKTYNL